MGGRHQDTLGGKKGKEEVIDIDVGNRIGPQKKEKGSATTLPAIGEMTQSLRYHLSGNEVHFHEDDEKIKVVLPVAEWWRAVEQVSNYRTGEYRYIDHTNGTMLELMPGINSDDQYDVLPRVSKIAEGGTGPTLAKLMSFTEKARKTGKK